MVTNLLTPDRVNVMWLSKSFSKECDRQEEWFGINYSVQGVSLVLKRVGVGVGRGGGLVQKRFCVPYF